MLSFLILCKMIFRQHFKENNFILQLNLANIFGKVTNRSLFIKRKLLPHLPSSTAFVYSIFRPSSTAFVYSILRAMFSIISLFQEKLFSLFLFNRKKLVLVSKLFIKNS